MEADRPRNCVGTLKISATAGVGSGAQAGGGRAARVVSRRGSRGPEDADCPRNGVGTLKIGATAGVGSGARAGGGRAARVAARPEGCQGSRGC